MTRYKPGDLARLGEGARRQIAAAKFAFQARENLRASKPGRKFGNVKTVVDGRKFDSRAEADRYWTLKTLQRSGFIEGLICQPCFPIEINGIIVARYFADFEYINRHGQRIIEDVKSKPTRTPIYRLKKKIVEALHGIVITEVMA